MERYDSLTRFGVEIANPVWRISLKKYASLSAPPAHVQTSGRFDDPYLAYEDSTESFSVLYCAQTAKAAFIESTGMFRTRLSAIEELVSQTLNTVEERESSSAIRLYAGVVSRD